VSFQHINLDTFNCSVSMFYTCLHASANLEVWFCLRYKRDLVWNIGTYMLNDEVTYVRLLLSYGWSYL